MLTILLISNTHGNLDIINENVDKVGSGCVIHAGDFWFYDEKSLYHLSGRELFLLISHSPYWRDYHVTKKTNKNDLAAIVEKHQLLGDFPDYLSGKKQFDVPVYAVWGNHEDVAVIKALKNENPVRNLYLLDAQNYYDLQTKQDESLTLYGLGGNFLPSKKLLQLPIAGQGGKAWMTLHEIGCLYKKEIKTFDFCIAYKSRERTAAN